MPSHCSWYLKCHPVSLHKPYFKWHDSIFKFTTKKYGLLCMLFYYRCKYVLDFYIVFFLSMLSQAVVFNKIFNLLYKQLIFIQCFLSEKSIWFPVPDMSTVVLFSWDWGQVDVTLHWRQRFNLASCPASLSLPQATRRANAEPTVATSFANDPFIVVNVGHTSHCDHACLQYLRQDDNTRFKEK